MLDASDMPPPAGIAGVERGAASPVERVGVSSMRTNLRRAGVGRCDADHRGEGAGLCTPRHPVTYTTPCATIARATFRKPAMFAPTT